MHIYLLCGLGADERLFRYLDLSKFDVSPIHWVPTVKNESMADYARKLVSQIHTPKPILIGVSFGGMIAVEMGKIIPTDKIILISSAAAAKEIPILYRLSDYTKLHRLFSGRFLKRSHRIMNWIMGATDPIRRELLTDMLQQTDEGFLYWAIDKVVTWKNSVIPSNVIRIHGTNDLVLPCPKEADYKIEGGGHLIVANRAGEVSKFINDALHANSVR